MTQLFNLYKRMIDAMGVEDLELPLSAVKIYKEGETIPDAVLAYKTGHLSLTSCQAAKQAALGDAVLLTRENIGCIAAAISFGLVDKDQETPLDGSRVYTDLMQGNSDSEQFSPPSPRDFSDGSVYACQASGHPEYALFGEEDSGRFKSQEIAQKAIDKMIAIQPATTQGVLFYAADVEELEVVPDVVVLSVRPVELTRIIQAYQYYSGERVEASMGGLRVVNSDLIVRPYLSGKINVSTYCLGARLIAKYEAERMGIGIPYAIFKDIVQGMEESRGGYPFYLYPGANSL